MTLWMRVRNSLSYKARYEAAKNRASHYETLYMETLNSHLKMHIENRELKRGLEYCKKRVAVLEMFGKGSIDERL